MTTNATVEARHKDMAAEAFGYSSWTRLSHSEGPRITAIALAQAQDKANLEAARAENADLANRLAEIDRFANAEMTAQSWNGSTLPRIAALASGHTPSPCPGCAAKDEAMGEIAEIADKYGPGSLPCRKIAAITARFIIPPADPVAEALKAAMLEAWPAYVRDQAESDCQREAEAIAKALDKQGHTVIAKSRLGGAK